MTKRLTASILLLAAVAVAQERWQARSMVITQRGIVGASQTLASQAGAMILSRGGSAVDAAIAVNAVLAVVEPMMCGLGGDLFALHRDARTGTLVGINASGYSGRNQSLAYLKSKGVSGVPTSGIHTVTVPGAVDGWWRMHQRFGILPWAELFAPAIYYASHGFPVTEIIQYDWAGTTDKLTGSVFLKEGRAPRVGEIFENSQLAGALEAVARGGRDAFYKGPISRAILKTSKRLGGSLEAEDFASYHADWVDPIYADYRGWRVYEMPPNSQGIGALMMLSMMQKFVVPADGQRTAEAFHLKIEAQKLAYQDLQRHIAEPASLRLAPASLLSDAYTTARAALIDPQKANCDTSAGAPEQTSHTVYLSVIDKDGNMVSWIQSNSDLWGSGVFVDGYGFALHDRGSSFSADPDHPNAYGPRKRPFHTIIPAYMEKGPEKIVFGIMRGSNQAQAHAQFVSNIADHGMNIQEALEAPRFTRRDPNGCAVMIEGRLPAAETGKLEQLGHRLDIRGEYSGYMGGGQAILLDTRTRTHYGASSPRKDGAAIPEPDPYFPKGNH